jgi:choline dehydrogenase-like flavoprotein
MRTGVIPWGPAHHDAFRNNFNHAASLSAICEDLPEVTNTVTLDPTLVDADGIPAPRISYRLGENTKRMMDHALARGREALQAAGAVEITEEAPVPWAGWHLIGTARMGDNPETSVVNSWGRCHDVRNLFIVDGSIFVTSGGENPTSTIQALALYVADQIKLRLADLFDENE